MNTKPPAAGKKRFPASVPGWSAAPTDARLTRPPALARPVANGARAALSAGAARQPAASGLGLDSQAVREAMVQRLRQQPEMHAQVLAALAQVPRHRFVETALVNQAYADTSLPIGWGQTISKPSVVARMLSLLVQGRSVSLGRVLEIGSGCGYQAAVLAQLARHVVSVERVHGLYAMSKRHLDELGVRNVNAVYGDGMRGYGPSAPYDAIIAAAGGEAIPEAWLAQLAVGGRLVAPCRNAQGVQSLVLIEHSITGFVRHSLEAVQFVPLKSGVVN